MFQKNKIFVSEIKTVIMQENSYENQSVIYYKNRSACDLAYTFSGESITSFNNNKLHLKSNSVLFLPRKQEGIHYNKIVSSTKFIDIIFNTFPELEMKPQVISLDNDIKVQKLFQKLYNVWIRKKDNYYHESMSILYEIIAILYDKGKIYQNKENTIQKGVDYLHSVYLKNDIDYTMPSKLCNMSYTNFKKKFINIYGIPPIKYITYLKLDYAKELLSTGIYTISEIAEKVGYNDIYYFSKVFKEKNGISPSGYYKSFKSKTK